MPKVEGYACDEMPEEFQGMEALAMQGIGYTKKALASVMGTTEEALDEAPVNGSNLNNPWYYLNYLAKGAITVVTQRSTIDEILGRTQEASWAHNSVTKQFRELTGRTTAYDDFVEGTVPRVNRGYTYEDRDVIRLSAGLVVTELENRQSAMIPGQYSPSQDKREAIALLFKLDRDAIGFYGYRLGSARCWGLLNDPNLANIPFKEVHTSYGGKKTWDDKDAHAIIRDIIIAVGDVQKRCKANFNPAKDAFKIVIPNGVDQNLGKITECGGYSVRQWIKDNYKKAEVIPTPVFNEALGGMNIMYVIVDKLGVSPVAEQIVPASAFLVGSQPREAGRSELWSMATCGCFVEQPLGIGRWFGL